MNKPTTIDVAQIVDLRELAEKIPDAGALCQLLEGTPRACEAEVMVVQTLRACVINHEKHGTPFSWRGDGVHDRGGNRLVDNGTAYATLLRRGYFVEDDRDSKVIIIVTQKLVDLLRGHLAKGDR